jgi:hypothetical protein
MRVHTQLMEHELVSAAMGGEIESVEVSALPARELKTFSI